MTFAPSRRTQAERSAATREALLDATVECLIEDGYDKTTTARVAGRAGVSRGAHLHHFQTRQALVAGAIEHLAARRAEELREAIAQQAPGPDHLTRSLDLVWESYAGPSFQAALDLWSHARTDPELRAQLIPVERALDRQTQEVTRTLFPELDGSPTFNPLVEMLVATVRGLAVLDTLQPDSHRSRSQWQSIRLELARLFEQALSD